MVVMTVRESATQAVEQVVDVVDRAQRWRVVRVFQRFTERDGLLLASGMSYQSLFALFAAVWVVFAVAGIWVRANRELYQELLVILNQAVPGLIGPNGIISEKALDDASVTLGITGVVALISLVWTAVGWLASTRTAIRTMFLLGNEPRNFAVQKSIDMGEALIFGIGLIASALISLLTNQVLDRVLGALGFDPESTPATIGANVTSVVIVFLINLATLLAMYRILSRLYIPRRDLLVGSAIGAIALSVLSQLSGLLLHGATKNSLLVPFAGLVGLLIWFDFVCAVILFGAAWIAVGMEDRGLSAKRMSPAELELERLRSEYRTRLDAAREEVREASTAFESTRGFLKRRRARTVLLRALNRLQAVAQSDPDRFDEAQAAGVGGPD